jgi:tetratricopeptide (TPR) repeat protein
MHNMRLITPGLFFIQCTFTLSVAAGAHTCPSPDAATWLERRAAVVKITSSTGAGSGFLVRSDGSIATAYHVIAGAETVWVHLPSGKAYAAEGVTAVYPEKDVAIIKLPASVVAGITPIPLATKEEPKGSKITAVGYPRGDALSVVEGVFLLSRRDPDGLTHLVLDSRVVSGCSGGPVLNPNAEAIGILVTGNNNGKISEAVDIRAATPLPGTDKPVSSFASIGKELEDSADNLVAKGVNVLDYWHDRDKKAPVPTSAVEWALSQFTQAVKKRPGFSLALVDKAICEYRLKRYLDVENTLRDAINYCPDDLQSHFLLSFLFIDRKMPEQAEKEIRIVVRLSPYFADGYAILGALLKGRAALSEAAEAFGNALQLEPNNVSWRIAMSKVLLSQENPAVALQHLGYATTLNPTSADAYYLTGVAYGKLKRHADSIEAQRMAIKINGTYALAHFQLASEYLLTGERAKALHEYGALKKLDPKLAALLHKLL